MAERLLLEIYTPEGVFLKEEVDEIEGPGYTGAFGILPQHTPYFVLLKTGVLNYRKEGEWKGVVIEPGYAVVEKDTVRIIVSAVESIDSINYEEEIKAKEKISQEMKGLSIDSHQFLNLENAYKKTIARIQAYERYVRKG